MDKAYCYEKCEKGKAFAQKVIWVCESAFDAALEFDCFVEECFKACPYKEFHREEKPND
jgi:hypothetical protein